MSRVTLNTEADTEDEMGLPLGVTHLHLVAVAQHSGVDHKGATGKVTVEIVDNGSAAGNDDVGETVGHVLTLAAILNMVMAQYGNSRH